jgi:type IV pilus assembly protein PilP
LSRSVLGRLLLACALVLGSARAWAQASKQQPPPAKGAAPAPAPQAPDQTGQTLLEQEDSALAGRAYTYDPAGRRDPFRSLLVRAENRGRGLRPPGIAGIAIDDITVQGIWKTRSGFVAQIRATDNKSYLLRAGDLLYDGEVTSVAPNEVTFRQNLNDPQSVKPFRDVTKQLNATIKP